MTCRRPGIGWLHIIVSAALLLPAAAWALSDHFVQEGVFLDGNGAVIEGDHTLHVRLWDRLAGGQVLLDETHEDVPFFEGYYAIAIGSLDDIDPAIFRGDVFLGIALDDGDELRPRTRLTKVPGAFVADVALDVLGDIHPSSVSIGERAVIDSDGEWVGPPGNLRGPEGPQGPPGPPGQAGGDGSPDTPQQVRDKLRQVDGAGSGIDADLLDGVSSDQFVRV